MRSATFGPSCPPPSASSLPARISATAGFCRARSRYWCSTTAIVSIPILTIEDYTGFFLTIILGLGIAFELPILMFFLALFGIVDARFLLRNFKYGIILIFIIAGVICPLPDPWSMCLFACPLLVLYLLGVGSGLPRSPIAQEVESEVTRPGTRPPRSCPGPIIRAVERPTSSQSPFTHPLSGSSCGSRPYHLTVPQYSAVRAVEAVDSLTRDVRNYTGNEAWVPHSSRTLPASGVPWDSRIRCLPHPFVIPTSLRLSEFMRSPAV